MIIKEAVTKCYCLFYGVDDVTILEHQGNIYKQIVSIMKQSTQEYYNMRMMLGLV